MTAWPVVISQCADCGAGTLTLGEYYMVKPAVWDQAWAGRRKSWHGKVPGQEILCIGCLETRIGRTLTRRDFTDAPINDPADESKSDRLRDRLTAKNGELKGINGAFAWLAGRMIEKLPPEGREAAWVSFNKKVLHDDGGAA